jgi:hypothetical protein
MDLLKKEKRMKKLTTTLIIGIVLLLSGAIVFAVCLANLGWDFTLLSNVTTKAFEHTESPESHVTNITIDYENTDILVYMQDTPTVRIVYPQAFHKNGNKATEVTVTETEDTLKITEKSINGWQFWNFTTPKTTLYLPADRTYTLTLSTNNGNITLNGQTYNVKGLDLETNNGNITVNGEVYSQTKITAETDNGNVKVKQADAVERICLQSNNGGITVENGVKAATLYIETNNGELSIMRADGQNITLETNVGNITSTIVGKQADFTIDADTDVGTTNLHSQTLGAKKLTVKTDVGNITVNFTE